MAWNIGTTFAPSSDPATRPALDTPWRSDAALAVYSRLSPDDWRGRHLFIDGEIVFPDAERASALFEAARKAALEDRDPVAALRLLEQSLRLDYIGALNGSEVLVRRAQGYEAVGRPEASRALGLYQIGCALSQLQWLDEAKSAYDAAAHLDPQMVWPLNNLAWLRSTAPSRYALSGSPGVRFAENACVLSGWGCWCFLGTLAAAFARIGDFRRAVAWQRISLHLSPREHKLDAATMLREFEAGRPWIEQERKVAAGGAIPAEDLARVDVEALVRRASKLMCLPRLRLH